MPEFNFVFLRMINYVNMIIFFTNKESRVRKMTCVLQLLGLYCITRIFRVEEVFAIFANLDFARNFHPAKLISTAHGISRNFPPAKFSSAKIKYK